MAEGWQAPHRVRADGDDPVLPLRDPRHQKVWLGHQRDTMARENRRRHDHVRDPRLVLQGEEDEALRGARPLANDDAARHLDSGAVLHAGQLARAHHPQAPERRAAQRHRMAAERHTRAGVIGGEALDVRHLGQRAGLARRIREQRPGMRHRRRPEIGPAAPAERRERADGRERLQFVPPELGPAREVVDGREWPRRPRPHDRTRRPLAQALHVPQPQPHHEGAVGALEHAQPRGARDVDRQDPQPVALRVLHDGRRVIEPHRLVVEERRVERRRMVNAQVRTRVGEQREAGGVRVVDDQVVREEVVISLDVEVIRFLDPDGIDGYDSIPVQIRFRQAAQLGRVEVPSQPSNDPATISLLRRIRSHECTQGELRPLTQLIPGDASMLALTIGPRRASAARAAPA